MGLLGEGLAEKLHQGGLESFPTCQCHLAGKWPHINLPTSGWRLGTRFEMLWKLCYDNPSKDRGRSL